MSIDLTTRYGDLVLRSPIIVGACPLTAEEMLRIAMVSAGVGAMVLPSLFEEQVVLWNERHGCGFDSSSAWSDDVSVLDRARRIPVNSSTMTGDSYLELVRRVSREMPVPVIASLNGECSGIWLQYATELQSAGAAAIELHVRAPAPSDYATPREMEDAILHTADCLTQMNEIPVFIKLGRNYTSLCHLVQRLKNCAQGVVLFGHSPQADISLDNFAVMTKWGLTDAGSIVKSLASIMRVREYCPNMSIAASGGIGDSTDFIKTLLAGADVAMITSAIYRDGPTVIGTMLEGLLNFMERRHIASIAELKTRGPGMINHDQRRLNYIEAFSETLSPNLVRCSNRVMEGDPWGHPR